MKWFLKLICLLSFLASTTSLIAVCYSADSTNTDEVPLSDETLSPPKTEDHHLIYHSRESHEFIASVTKDGSPLLGIGPKPREGGLGPRGSVEISPWVKSTKWIRNMEDGSVLEFVFDPDLYSVYVAINSAKVIGHCHLKNISSVANPYGGNIKKIGQIFRTDEFSGHFGYKWHDSLRFKFIELMSSKGIAVLHEPWVRDSVLLQQQPDLYKKKISGNVLNDEECTKLKEVSENQVFGKFSIEDLSYYQDNFLRKFGNSIFNPAFMLAMWITPWSTPPSALLYEQDRTNPLHYSLKDEFKDKGQLDLKFYTPENGFPDPNILEDLLFEYFKDKQAD